MVDPKTVARRGVHKREDEVFHFPKVEPNGLNDMYKPHLAVGHDPGGPSMTRQDMKEECDVNEIMARYEHTGVLPAVVGEPFYYDFTTLPETYLDAMNQMRDAQEAFMTLPAKVRKEFDNDPAQFVDFAVQDENLDQMREWGLAPPAPAPQAPAGPAEPAPGVAPGARAPEAAAPPPAATAVKAAATQ